MHRSLFLFGCVALLGCSSSDSGSAPPQVAAEASVDAAAGDEPAPEAGPTDAPSADAASEQAPQVDAPAGDAATSFGSCENACKDTALTLTFGATTEAIDRAQYGVNADGTLHIETHFGGDPACPSQSSPTPDRTVIFANVPVPVDTTALVNVQVTLLDFKGTLSQSPVDKSTSSKLTPVAVGPGFVAFDAEAAFPDGTLAGHVYATHCDSLDE